MGSESEKGLLSSQWLEDASRRAAEEGIEEPDVIAGRARKRVACPTCGGKGYVLECDAEATGWPYRRVACYTCAPKERDGR